MKLLNVSDEQMENPETRGQPYVTPTDFEEAVDKVLRRRFISKFHLYGVNRNNSMDKCIFKGQKAQSKFLTLFLFGRWLVKEYYKDLF
jgi:hypothetical protein